MEITLLQGIALAIMAIIVGIDFWLEGLFIFRPIIVCTLTGILIGNVQAGLITGGLTELTFAGLTPAGGTQPPNPVLAGVMATVIAHTTGQDATISVALALPFSFLMQYIILFFYSSFSLFMRKADEYADEADTRGLLRLNILTTSIVGITYGIVVFLCAYVAQSGMSALVQAMPEWLIHGFEVAGGILPAVGFGMLLKVMLKAEYMPYLLIGFLIACFLTFSNLLPVAIAGTALALIAFNRDRETAKLLANTNVSKGDDEDGI